MRKRIAGDAVGAGLQQDYFRAEGAQIFLHPRPGAIKIFIIGARRQWDVEFGVRRRTAAGLAGGTGAGIKKPPVFVQIGERQVGIVFKRIKHAVAVMRVNVHIGDAPNLILRAQGFNQYAAVIERAEAGGRVAARVVQAGDGNERARRLAGQHARQRVQIGADHITRGVK